MRLLARPPDWLDPLWELARDALGLWAVVLVVAVPSPAAPPRARARRALSGRARRWRSPVVPARRRALARSDDLGRLRVDEATFPVLWVALAATVVLRSSPHLVRPLQRVARFLLVLGLLGGGPRRGGRAERHPRCALVALVAATVVRLAFGTSAGHPEAAAVAAALRELGVEGSSSSRRPAARRRLRRARARRRAAPAREGVRARRLRHAAAREGLADGAVRRRRPAPEPQPARGGRARGARHAARAAGRSCRRATSTRPPSRRRATPCSCSATPPTPLAPSCGATTLALARAWEAVAALGAARIAHHRIDPDTLVAFGEEVGLVDLDRATIAARPEHLLVDRAQLHATFAALVGLDRAVAPRPRRSARRAWPRSSRTFSPRASGRGCRARSTQPTSTSTTCATRRRRPPASRRRRSSGYGASPGARRPGRAPRTRGLGRRRLPQRPRLRRPRGRRPGGIVGLDRPGVPCSHRRRVSHRRSRRWDRSPRGSRTCRSTSCSWRPATSISRSPRTSPGWRSTSASSSGTASHPRRRSPRARSTRSSRP